MWISNAEVGGRRVDVRLRDGEVALIAEPGSIAPDIAEPLLDARGGALLPGLHDHHIHLSSFAASQRSVRCGPPEVRDAGALARALKAAHACSGTGWLRGIGYHESVAGEIDRTWLDRVLPDRPVRIQHRSGRLWILNSAALERLSGAGPTPLERVAGRLTGRLYDADEWLRARLGSHYPDLTSACATLAGYGITGLTDASASNDRSTLEHLSSELRAGAISQSLLLMGAASLSAGPSLAGVERGAEVEVGALKVHLHDEALPELSHMTRRVARAHEQGRAVAFHCVTEAELSYALGVLEAAGSASGDRIEHAGIASPLQVSAAAERGVAVVTQPHFIAERGDRYYEDVPLAEHAWLYRGAAWLKAGVALAGGSDAPYGSANPWVAMHAAVNRRTAEGRVLGAEEALTPEQALDLYLSPAAAPGQNPRRVRIGAPADLCLLDRSWGRARAELSAVQVLATFRRGRLIARRPLDEIASLSELSP
ncbi:MAG TPA: amidohydrolase family protein [Steroidobacteraceae bacterium]|nr:amidohydrolase family protein [Steroidobacteraceae bacterium]